MTPLAATPDERAPLILLVEDNSIDQLAVKAMLSRAIPSADIRSATTLAEAVDTVTSGATPDIAVLDLHLPDAGGTEIVTVLRDTVPDAAVVVLTGSGDDIGVACIEHGAHQYLPKKDLETERLGRTVEAARATASAQRDLANALRARDRLISDVDEFLSVVAHDLRAPLRTARLYADRLTTDPARASMWSERLDGSLGRMDDMVQAVLRYGEMGRVRPEPAIVDLADVGRALQDDLRHDLSEADATLTWSAEGKVACDPTMLRQVIANLIVNSLRYRCPDRPPAITVEATDHRTTMAITVTDNGMGIEPEYWERIFRPFERLENDDGTDGLGLGLAAARRLLSLNEASLHVGESDTTGTTMRMIIPAAPATHAAAPAHNDPAPSPDDA